MEVVQLKKDKMRLKTAFTKEKNKVLDTFHTETELSLSLLNPLTKIVDDLNNALNEIVEYFEAQNDVGNCEKTLKEIERVEHEYTALSDLISNKLNAGSSLNMSLSASSDPFETPFSSRHLKPV